MSDWNAKVIETFRANHGKVPNFSNMLLLTTRGAKTGQLRTFPLAYSRDGDAYVIAASKGGSPTNPDWYHNLLKNPEATVEIGDETFTAHAVPASGGERDRLWAVHVAGMPAFREYETKTTRTIPVLVLKKAA